MHHVGRLPIALVVMALAFTGCGGLDAGQGPGPTATPAEPRPSPSPSTSATPGTAAREAGRSASPAATPSASQGAAAAPTRRPSTTVPRPSTMPTPRPTATGSPTAGPTPSGTPTSDPTPTASPPAEPTTTPTPTPTDDPPAERDTPPVLERGDEGEAVRTVQGRLEDLGYWIGPVDGVFGRLTEQAVLAFQGWEEITRDGIVGPETRGALADAQRPHVDHEQDDLVFIDEHRGVLLAIRDGRTRWAFHASAGSYEHYQHDLYGRRLADTPNGTWEIYRQVDGTTESPLGVLNRPKYFHEDGIAVHGSPNVPPFGVSHGCVRVTNAAIDLIWAEGLAPVGTTVVVTGPEP